MTGWSVCKANRSLVTKVTKWGKVCQDTWEAQLRQHDRSPKSALLSLVTWPEKDSWQA